MSKVVKLVAAVFSILVVLLVLAAVVVAWRFDPNDYKSYVEDYVKQATGRDLTLAENLDLSFFPWLAVETGGITLGNAPGFEAQPFATIEHAAVRVKLMPLLSRQVEIGTIVLEGVTLNLAQDADGRGNWEDLAGAGADGDTAASGDAAAPALAQLNIAGLSIREGTIAWRENVAELRYTVTDLALTTGHIALGAPIGIETSMSLRDVAAQTSLALELEGSVEIDADGALAARDLEISFRLADAEAPERAAGSASLATLTRAAAGPIDTGTGRVQATLAGAGIGPDPLPLEASWSGARFDSASGALAVEGLTTRSGELAARWEIASATLLESPRVTGSVEIADAPLAALLAWLRLDAPAGVDPATLGAATLATRFTVEADGPRVALEGLRVRALGASLAGAATLSERTLTAEIDVPAFTATTPLRALLAAQLPADVDAGAFERLALSGAVRADLDSGAFGLSGLRAELLGATLTGDVTAEPQGNDKRYRGTIKTSRFAPDAFVRAFRPYVAQPLSPAELGPIAVDTRFVYDGARDTLTLDPVDAELFGLAGRGAVTATSLTGTPVFKGQLAVERFAPRELFARFGAAAPATSDPGALVNASVSTRFTVEAERGRFEDIVLALDQSRITGSFDVEGFQNSRYRFALGIDSVDVDRYLPPSAAEAEAGEATAGDIELPVDALSGLDLAGEVTVGHLALAGMSFDEVGTEIAIGQGRAGLENARAKLYGGSFAGALRVESSGPAPSLALNGKATGLTLAPLIQALTGEPANVSGTGSFDLALAGRGPKVIDNVKTAAGDLSFTLENGAIKGFNLGRTLCAVYNSAQKVAQPAKAEDVTAYQTIRGTAKVTNGVAQSNDLLARTTFMDVTGKGSLGLAEQRLDYDLVAKLTGAIAIAGCESMKPLIGDSIPLTLRGTVSAPEILPDFSAILRQRLREEAEKSITNRLQERLQDLVRPR